MTPTIDMDSILGKAGWEQWRTAHLGDSGALAVGARLWCASSHWRAHTPRLENWKTVLRDLQSQPLTESMLVEMAGPGDRQLPFPAIPLFEDEQLRDFCNLLRDADAAAALAERLQRNGLLLTLDPETATRRCWEYIPAAVKKGIDFSAWLWMFAGDRLPPSLPSQAAVDELKRVRTPRTLAAIVRLVEAVRDGTAGAYPVEAMNAVAAALVSTSPAPPPATFRREEHTLSCPRLAQHLFHSFSDGGEWRMVQASIVRRQLGDASTHPLAELTRYLRENDFSTAQDEQAWKNLQSIFRQFPQLLEVDAADPGAPLPALELVCSVRSTMTPGTVALGLLPLAPQCLRSSRWWNALRLALRPAPRRGGWFNANDRWQTAIQTVKRGARQLDAAERTAMSDGLFAGAGEGIDG